LLGDIERITEEDVRNKPNDRKMQRHWRQLMAKRLWENLSEFTAMGIVPDPNVQEHVIDEGLSIFFGPPWTRPESESNNSVSCPE
jgi:hypothetical protein